MRMIVEAFKDTLELGLEKPEQVVVRISHHLSSLPLLFNHGNICWRFGYPHDGDILLNHAGTAYHIKLLALEHFRLLQP